VQRTQALPRVAYLTGEYPAVSHTFILREVAALRAIGFSVLTCSVRRTAPNHYVGPAEKAAAEDTYYVLHNAKNLLTLISAQAALLRWPKRYLSTLWLAWRMRAPGLRATLYQMFYFAEATVLAQHLRRERAQHLHNHFADGSANVAVLAAQLADIPFSYTLHGPAELFEPQRWALAEKTARARFVACISHFARSQAMYFSDPAHWPKLRIVHCGVVPELYAQSPGGDPDVMQLIFVGRLTAIKGLPVLLDAFARAAADRPNLKLCLVGDGDGRAALQARAAPLGDAVEFVGYKSQSEVAALLARSDALILPSFAEGVPVVLMEAMASKKPVIATQVAGVSELVEHGVSGFLVPPGDPHTLADRIGQLSDAPELRSKMGEAGYNRVCAEFDVRIEAARIGALFAGLGGDAPRPDPLETRGTDISVE
jgi:glycosyltransferase involved in cell wall biosynthesis